MGITDARGRDGKDDARAIDDVQRGDDDEVYVDVVECAKDAFGGGFSRDVDDDDDAEVFE